jgi:hypothetical protein
MVLRYLVVAPSRSVAPFPSLEHTISHPNHHHSQTASTSTGHCLYIAIPRTITPPHSLYSTNIRHGSHHPSRFLPARQLQASAQKQWFAKRMANYRNGPATDKPQAAADEVAVFDTYENKWTARKRTAPKGPLLTTTAAATKIPVSPPAPESDSDSNKSTGPSSIAKKSFTGSIRPITPPRRGSSTGVSRPVFESPVLDNPLITTYPCLVHISVARYSIDSLTALLFSKK